MVSVHAVVDKVKLFCCLLKAQNDFADMHAAAAAAASATALHSGALRNPMKLKWHAVQRCGWCFCIEIAILHSCLAAFSSAHAAT